MPLLYCIPLQDCSPCPPGEISPPGSAICTPCDMDLSLPNTFTFFNGSTTTTSSSSSSSSSISSRCSQCPKGSVSGLNSPTARGKCYSISPAGTICCANCPKSDAHSCPKCDSSASSSSSIDSSRTKPGLPGEGERGLGKKITLVAHPSTHTPNVA